MHEESEQSASSSENGHHGHDCSCGHDHDHLSESLQHHHRGDAICIDQVSFSYAANRDRMTLDSITMHIPNRTRLGIVGPNGGGKSTLLRIILGLLDPTGGSVSVLNASPIEACRQNLIGYVPQRSDVEYEFPLSAKQIVMQGRVGKAGLFRRFTKDDHDIARNAMREVGIESIANRPIGNLSGGQQQRVFIARALAVQPKILILDEPMAAIDEAGQDAFAKLMDEIHREHDVTILLVSHDLRAIVAGCDQVACLNHRLHFHDAPTGLTREVLEEVFEHNLSGVGD